MKCSVPEDDLGIVKAICISTEKGTAKTEVDSAEFVVQYGIKGDAHAGSSNRQVSLLSLQKIEEFRKHYTPGCIKDKGNKPKGEDHDGGKTEKPVCAHAGTDGYPQKYGYYVGQFVLRALGKPFQNAAFPQ